MHSYHWLSSKICQRNKISTHLANFLAPALNRDLDRDSGALLTLEHVLEFCPGRGIAYARGSDELVRNRLFIFHCVLLDHQATLNPCLPETDMEQSPGCKDGNRRCATPEDCGVMVYVWGQRGRQDNMIGARSLYLHPDCF